MRNAALLLLPLVAIVFLTCAGPRQVHRVELESGPALIPLPLRITPQSGFFQLDATTVIVSQPAGELPAMADYLVDLIRRGTGWQLTRGTEAVPAATAITLELTDSTKALGVEGYRLEITPRQVRIQAAQPAGLFYGIQTLRQLWPAVWENSNPKSAATPARIPCLTIDDQPRYAWRGMMLDVSRHFFPKEFIYQFIDYLAMNKMNTFHWHLADDQGWRIEIKKYPKLTEVGAWRVDRESDHWNNRTPQQENEKATYGGFYTQAEIRDIVAYARSRFITIVPEIEMPAHAGAALAAYPWFSCTGGPFTVPPGGVWPIVNIYCAGNDSTFTFLQEILDEVIGLFPGQYIHVGGDEADKTEWKKCPKCQARIRSENLKDETELQSYMIRRMEAYLNSRGKRLIGWDEILDGGLAPRATVMSWRGMQGGIDAARSYHDVVMCPTDFCYFDYYQGSPDLEPPGIGGFLPLARVYSFEPTPEDLTVVQASHILGCQANLWTEFIPTPEHAQYMLFPRMLALAEVAWSPKTARNWHGFLNRLTTVLPRLDEMGINYAHTIFNVQSTLEMKPNGKSAQIVLQSVARNMEIRYTTDNSLPTAFSPIYSEPISVSRSTTITAGLFRNGVLQGKTVTVPFLVHKASAKKVTYAYPFSERYRSAGPGSLVDGRRGTTHYSDGAWQGFEKNNLEVIIDLGKKMVVKRVTSSYLENIGSWIFGPRRVIYSFSEKGEIFITLANLSGREDRPGKDAAILDFSQSFEGIEARYIKVVAVNIGTCPPGHAGAGEKAWLFADEIVVE
jgi:hexosaminidase